MSIPFAQNMDVQEFKLLNKTITRALWGEQRDFAELSGADETKLDENINEMSHFYQKMANLMVRVVFYKPRLSYFFFSLRLDQTKSP